jgi:DNA-binding CsgD family transcriptional regulator
MRETEVLRLMALGFTASEIAERLYLSQRTIETHRRQMYKKLGLQKRSELVRYALSRHLIGDPDTVAWQRVPTADSRVSTEKADRARQARRPRVRTPRGSPGPPAPSPACTGAHDSAPEEQRSERLPPGPQ